MIDFAEVLSNTRYQIQETRASVGKIINRKKLATRPTQRISNPKNTITVYWLVKLSLWNLVDPCTPSMCLSVTYFGRKVESTNEKHRDSSLLHPLIFTANCDIYLSSFPILSMKATIQP
jgi:hypothetical protein